MTSLDFLYRTVPGRIILKLLASRAVSKICGLFLDSRYSAFLIDGFAKKNNIDLSDYQLDGITTFNEFFRRKIKEGKRQFNQDTRNLCAPCDGLLSVWNIDENGGTVIPVKQSHYTTASLLQDKKLASEYNGGLCLVFRLCVDNYHRYCYAESGTKSENIFIPGKLHTVRPVALENLPVFTENCREYTVIETSSFGKLIQMEVGAMLVGRIVNLEKSGKIVRGTEKGFFEYGGSTIILLVKKETVIIRSDITENSRNGTETPVKMGEVIASHI